jgi:hypothetical protein
MKYKWNILTFIYIAFRVYLKITKLISGPLLKLYYIELNLNKNLLKKLKIKSMLPTDWTYTKIPCVQLKKSVWLCFIKLKTKFNWFLLQDKTFSVSRAWLNVWDCFSNYTTKVLVVLFRDIEKWLWIMMKNSDLKMVQQWNRECRNFRTS